MCPVMLSHYELFETFYYFVLNVKSVMQNCRIKLLSSHRLSNFNFFQDFFIILIVI